MSNNKQTKSELAACTHGQESHPTELLPCPFCGAQSVADVFDDEEDHFHIVSCENKACPANVCAVGKTGEEAAALWNTRNGGAA